MVSSLQLIIPVIATFITTCGAVSVAYISKSNKPVRDVLRRTKLKGDEGLVEALGVLQKQLIDEQSRSDKIIKDAQRRHQEEISYYVEQLRISREEIKALRIEKNAEIQELRNRLEEHELRLNEGHVGDGK